MKKILVLFLFVFFPLYVYSQDKVYKPEIVNYLFNNYNVNTEDIHLWIYKYKSKSQLAGIIFNRDGNIKLYVGTSGYYLNLSNIEINDSFLFISFIKIWTGAEEYINNDSRYFEKFNLLINRETIENNFSWVIDIFDVIPVFEAKDNNHSINYNKSFSVKNFTYAKKECSDTSENVFCLSSNNNFDIIDINCNYVNKNDLWIKVFFDGKYGYIPFDALNGNWAIVENNLDINIE